MEENKSNVVRMEKKDTVKRALPNKAFDMEYHTERYREVQFLAERGIHYTFVKRTKDYGVSQYKYKKTPALFAALVEFYSMLEAEKNVKKNNVVSIRKEVKQAEEIPAAAVTEDDTE